MMMDTASLAHSLASHVVPENTAALSAHLAHASAQSSDDAPVTQRIVGAGTWLTAGRPMRAAQSVSLRQLTGVVEYVPGDLTLTARAGTSLADLDAITRAEGQWLAMDPAGDRQGTIGATVATASCGPLALGFGRVRDIVLGLELVNGSGVVTRAGGRVVKNVAGFDLVRLQIGAWGTLGVLTEISLRLRALPEVDETVAISLDARASLSAHVVAMRELALAPLALELVGAPLAAHLGLPAVHTWLMRLGGNAERVRFQREQAATLGDTALVDNTIWSALSAIETPSCAVARVSQLPIHVAELWLHAHDAMTQAGLTPCFAHASLQLGTLRLVIPRAAALTDAEFASACASVAQRIALPGGHVVWERLPAVAWSAVPSLVRDRISAGLKRAFDPHHLLNRGLLGETRPA